MRTKNLTSIMAIMLTFCMMVTLFGNTIGYAQDFGLLIVQDLAEKNLPNNQGKIAKSITAADPTNGEVTVELKVSNTGGRESTAELDNAEIFLVFDISLSMEAVTPTGETRLDIAVDGAKSLLDSIFDKAPDVKVGIVTFHGHPGGFFGTAGINNAQLAAALTSNKSTLTSKMDSILKAGAKAGTNIDAGLQMAERNFSKNCENKIIVLLTDGVPNADVKGNYKKDDASSLIIHDNTKATLEKLDAAGHTIITMMAGMDLEDFYPHSNPPGPFYENQEALDADLKIVEKIFGTEEKPTAGKFYNIGFADYKKVVEEDLVMDVISQVQKVMKTVAVEDFFPADTIKHFSFELVGKPSIGTVTSEIDDDDRNITWTIGTLIHGQTAALKYKLKMKDMNDKDLLGKVFSTNEKVVLDYVDSSDEDQQVILDRSPRVKLGESCTECENIDCEDPHTPVATASPRPTTPPPTTTPPSTTTQPSGNTSSDTNGTGTSNTTNTNNTAFGGTTTAGNNNNATTSASQPKTGADNTVMFASALITLTTGAVLLGGKLKKKR